jgi:hypothetical protein
MRVFFFGLTFLNSFFATKNNTGNSEINSASYF